MADGDAELEPDPLLDDGLRAARPDVDVVAAVAQARVLSALFGAEAAAPVRIGRYEVERRLGEGGGGVVYAATDPELSRRVAIKLIRSEGQQGRVLAEGHALAKLSHPNIVPLHDVGTVDDRVFLVMELVEGETLRAYVAGAPRTVADVVRVYRQAGEGLAAAHRAGIVHRDFKPDNAVVGADGRVRVVDFGLARAGAVNPDSVVTRDERGGSGPSSGGGDGGGAVHTRAGIGTPRYMAPEQVAGDPLTAATDQYAFCVSLREALGARKAKVPRWIEPILTRGTSRVPEARYPSMAALLAALARDPATVWRRRGVALGAVAAVGAAVAAFAAGRAGDAGPACDGGPAELAAVWTPAARAKVAAHLAGLGTPYAASAAPTLLATFDGYGTSWLAGHRAACEAHRSGAQSPQLLDQRMACLARARAAFGASVDVATSSTADGLADTVKASADLPSLARCNDVALLVDRGEMPTPAQAAAVAELDAELARLSIEVAAARMTSAASIDDHVERAERVGFRPAVARAKRLLGIYRLIYDDREKAIEPLHRAGTLALSIGDALLAVDVMARELWARGTSQQPASALDSLDFVAAMASRLPPSAHAERALVANNTGSVALAAGQRARAREAFATANAELDAISGTLDSEQLGMRRNILLALDDPRERDESYARAVAATTAALGADHPETLTTRLIGAAVEPDAAAAEATSVSACNAFVELHPNAASRINECSFELGLLAIARADASASHRAFARVVMPRIATAAPLRAKLAAGYLAMLDGDRAGAIAVFTSFDRELRAEGAELPWYRRRFAAEAQIGLAMARRLAQDRSGERAALEQAKADLAAVIKAQPGAIYQRRAGVVDAALAAPR
jgi:predicted Ser/Thr protein kinase